MARGGSGDGSDGRDASRRDTRVGQPSSPPACLRSRGPRRGRSGRLLPVRGGRLSRLQPHRFFRPGDVARYLPREPGGDRGAARCVRRSDRVSSRTWCAGATTAPCSNASPGPRARGTLTSKNRSRNRCVAPRRRARRNEPVARLVRPSGPSVRGRDSRARRQVRLSPRGDAGRDRERPDRGDRISRGRRHPRHAAGGPRPRDRRRIRRRGLAPDRRWGPGRSRASGRSPRSRELGDRPSPPRGAPCGPAVRLHPRGGRVAVAAPDAPHRRAAGGDGGEDRDGARRQLRRSRFAAGAGSPESTTAPRCRARR